MRKYSNEQKIQIIYEYYNSILFQKDIAEKYKISKDTFKRWVQLYKIHGEDAFNTSIENQRYFTKKFKESIVNEVLIEKKSQNQV